MGELGTTLQMGGLFHFKMLFSCYLKDNKGLFVKRYSQGLSLVVQCLKSIFRYRGCGFDPGWGTKPIPTATEASL